MRIIAETRCQAMKIRNHLFGRHRPSRMTRTRCLFTVLVLYSEQPSRAMRSAYVTGGRFEYSTRTYRDLFSFSIRNNGGHSVSTRTFDIAMVAPFANMPSYSPESQLEKRRSPRVSCLDRPRRQWPRFDRNGGTHAFAGRRTPRYVSTGRRHDSDDGDSVWYHNRRLMRIEFVMILFPVCRIQSAGNGG